MAEAVAGLLASAFVGIAKDKLGSAIAEQANLLCYFSGDLENMRDDLEIISAFLKDAERRSVKEELVQLLLKRLKHVAIDISDVLEDYQDTSDDQATTKNLGVLSCIPTTYKKIATGNRMKSLRTELMKINKDFVNFQFINTQEGTRTTIVQNYDKLETTSYVLPGVQGREGEKQEIINLIHASSNHDERETVIVPIYALGGMGKSTLAQLVYNDGQFKKQYDCQIWVHVSQDFNLLKIGSSIISQLPVEAAQQNRDLLNSNLQVIIRCLDKLLCTKKVLIVLDDLWEKDDTELRKLKSMLDVGKKVHVIVTTREEEIARKVSTSKPYMLQPLKDDICWEIIKRSSNCNQKEFEQIGLDIAQKCGGVPLAAQALGGMLQSKDLSEWKKINDSDIWNEITNDKVLPSLKLSYHRMPQHLRICFSYCAIFSKGHNIVEDDLIHQWSLLGFIKASSEGKEYIKHLLGMSFLQVSKMPSTSQEHVVRYTMHDLVHDLAILTVEDELIVFDATPGRKKQSQKYCRYALLKNYDPTMKLVNMPSKVRALRFSDSGEQLDIQNGAFSFARCLRTLDFSECSAILLPASIGRLKQLRCLIAPRMQNESLPECITELSKLQYLNINGSSKITRLPESICNLGCLQYLSLSGCSSISKLPESIGNLGCLQYLSLSGCSNISKLSESFGDLKCIVHLDMSGCSWLRELPASLGNLKNLQHLELSRCSSVKAIPESLCGLTQLEYLNLSSCACLEGLPAGIGRLVGMKHLDLSGCRQISELPESLMKLQSLSHLNLSYCWGIWRVSSLARLRGLTALQHLDISNLRLCSYEQFLDYFIGTLTNLEHLDISRNSTILYLPNSIGNLKRLHTLDLSYCSGLSSLPQSIGTLGLKSLLLDGCSDELMDQASSLVHYSHTLPVFKVRVDNENDCSNLDLLEGVHVSELRIRSLENVRFPEEASKVKLSEKHDLSELTLAWSRKHAVRIVEDKDVLEQLVPPTSLKSMHLEGYRCTSFPGWLMDISRHLSNLVYIRLYDLPACTNLPPLGQLPHLEKLQLWNLPGIKRIDRDFCGGKGAFRRLSFFDVDNMDGLEEWNTRYSVTDSVEEFMFPVLDYLEICDCPRLRLKPCLPIFRECRIFHSDQVISSLEETDKTSHHCSSTSPAIKLELEIQSDSCKCIRLFQHFPALRELFISGRHLESVLESVRHLTSLESLTLAWCYCISELPEWLGDLSSLKCLIIKDCEKIKALPASIHQLTRLQKIEIETYSEKLKNWCESEENKSKLAHIYVQFTGDCYAE